MTLCNANRKNHLRSSAGVGGEELIQCHARSSLTCCLQMQLQIFIISTVRELSGYDWESKHLADRIKKSLRKQFVNRELSRIPIGHASIQIRINFKLRDSLIKQERDSIRSSVEQCKLILIIRELPNSLIRVQTFVLRLFIWVLFFFDFACHAKLFDNSTQLTMQEKHQCRQLRSTPSATQNSSSRSQIASQSKRLWRF